MKVKKTLTFENTLYHIIDNGDIGNGWKYVEVINKKMDFALPKCLYYKGKQMKNLLCYSDYVNHLDTGKEFINDFIKDIFRECYPGSKNPICKVKENLMIGGGPSLRVYEAFIDMKLDYSYPNDDQWFEDKESETYNNILNIIKKKFPPNASVPQKLNVYIAYKIIGKIICSQGGHKLTNQLLREVFQNKENFTIVEIKEKNIPHSLINRKYLRSIA